MYLCFSSTWRPDVTVMGFWLLKSSCEVREPACACVYRRAWCGRRAWNDGAAVVVGTWELTNFSIFVKVYRIRVLLPKSLHEILMRPYWTRASGTANDESPWACFWTLFKFYLFESIQSNCREKFEHPPLILICQFNLGVALSNHKT